MSVFARLAVTSTAVRECHEVLDAFDGVRVSFDNGFAVVELVQESTFGSSSVCRDMDSEERVSVTEEVRDDVSSELVNGAVEMEVSTVGEESRVISRVEVSCRVKSRRVFGSVEGRIDTEEMIVGVDASAADAVNRAVVFRLVDQSSFSSRIMVESCDESMGCYSEDQESQYIAVQALREALTHPSIRHRQFLPISFDSSKP